MRKVIGIGETILDIIFTNDQPQKAVPGGSVFNTSVSLGRLGVPVTFLGEVGNDKVGDMICRFMKENNISTEYLDRFPDGKSPVSLAFLNEEHNAEYLFYHDYPGERLHISLPPIDENDILIIGSYYALNPVIHEKIAELLVYAKERKAIIYYDLNFRKAHVHEAIRLMPTVLENLEYADIVRGSEEDFFNLFKKTDTEAIYKGHIRYYCKQFVATHGGNGIDLFTGTFHNKFETPSFTPVSTIGAGDSFNAGIIYALLKYDVRREDLPALAPETWAGIIDCGTVLAREVCLSYDNYISTRPRKAT